MHPIKMSLSPNSSIVNRTIDLNYANKKRSSSLKWLVINFTVLLLFVYDLWHSCAGYSSASRWAEAACACALAANVALYGARALRCRRAPLALTPRQQRLLGLSRSVPSPSASPASPGRAPRERSPSPAPSALALSPARVWRAGAGDASPPPSPPSPAGPVSPRLARLSAADEFIADHRSLADYLREQGARAAVEGAGEAWAGRGRGAVAASPPLYQLAAPDAPLEGSPPEEAGAGAGARAEEAGAGGGAGALAWRRLALQPALLTAWNQNLRLWLHATILRRLVAEMERADAALPADARLGHAPLERLQKLPAAAALLPYLRPFADQRYAVARVRELARGGCLSAYRWAGGGAGWDEARPTDAELLLALLAAYLDAQLGGAFSAAHLSAAPAPPPRHAGALAVHRASAAGARPPHYVLALRDEAVEVGRGRNNLLHTLLLFIAAAARAEPPALARVHLGPAGLNMLWIIGR